MEKKNSTFILVGVGCGCLFLLLLCVASGGAYIFLQARSEPAWPPSGPATPPGGVAYPGDPTVAVAAPPSPAGVADVHRVTATITSASGLPNLGVGSQCVASVGRADRPDGTFWCNAQVLCGGTLVYGGATAGYFPCTIFSGDPWGVSGSEDQTTSVDQDPAFRIDTRAGILEARDDAAGALGAYSVTTRIDRVE